LPGGRSGSRADLGAWTGGSADDDIVVTILTDAADTLADHHEYERMTAMRYGTMFLAAIAAMLASPILEDLPFSSGDSVLALVNGMGGTPLIELYVVFNELAKILKGRNITIARNLVGSYITSLDMAGCSITLLKLDDELTNLWDAPVHTPALRWGA